MISLTMSLVLSAAFHVEVVLAEPVTTATTFEVAISRGTLAVQHAKTVKQPNGDVLYFISNATGQDSDLDFANGPIAHLRTRELPRGYAIVLTPRVETTVVLQSGAIIATSRATSVAPKAASDIKRVDASVAQPNTLTTESADPSPADRRENAERRSQAAEARLANSEGRPPRLAAQPIDDRGSSPMRNFGLLAGLLAVGAAVVVYGKKVNKKKGATGTTEGIDLVAVKALGAKQRLAVVDACGDRLLIATSEQGVQLLSKLEGGTGVHKIPTDFLASLAQAESASPVPTTHVTPVNTSKDLAGLVQLRARRATWTSVEPLA